MNNGAETRQPPEQSPLYTPRAGSAFIMEWVSNTFSEVATIIMLQTLKLANAQSSDLYGALRFLSSHAPYIVPPNLGTLVECPVVVVLRDLNSQAGVGVDPGEMVQSAGCCAYFSENPWFESIISFICFLTFSHRPFPFPLPLL